MEKLYEIKLPSGRIVTPPNGSCRLLTKDRYAEFLKDNRIWFGKDGNGVPRIKRFLSEVRESVVAMSHWKHSEVGHTQDAKLRHSVNSRMAMPQPQIFIPMLTLIQP